MRFDNDRNAIRMTSADHAAACGLKGSRIRVAADGVGGASALFKAGLYSRGCVSCINYPLPAAEQNLDFSSELSVIDSPVTMRTHCCEAEPGKPFNYALTSTEPDM